MSYTGRSSVTRSTDSTMSYPPSESNIAIPGRIADALVNGSEFEAGPSRLDPSRAVGLIETFPSVRAIRVAT